MNKRFNTLFFCFFMSLIFCSALFSQPAQKSAESTKGKIIIVILDVSGSIKNQFADITKIIDRSVIEKRLSVGDYFVLIPFGDSARPLYSGQLLREEDKASISNTLTAIKADNDYTDIGSALKTALNYIVDLKNQEFNLYEPLVLFITDGDITTPASSEFYMQHVDSIFNDPLISQTDLYNGWYFVGIGKNLHDLPLIAEKSGRANFLLRIEDIDRLEILLDEWISNIPEPERLEQKSIFVRDVFLEKTALQKDKRTLVKNEAHTLSFVLQSDYERTPATFEFTNAYGIFQSNDKALVTNIAIHSEAGKITLLPQEEKRTEAGFVPEKTLHGKGTLKLYFEATVNGVKNQYEEQFDVEEKSAALILLSKLIPLFIVLFILIVLFVAYTIFKAFLPVNVSMRISGQSQKSRAVSVKIKKRVDFGSKPGAPFKLDAELFAPQVGQLVRKSAKAWCINVRDSSAFSGEEKIISYTLGAPVTLTASDGSEVTVTFFKVGTK